MNEQLQKMIIDFLQKLTTGMEQGSQIVASSLPALVKQYLMWKGGEDVLVLFLCLFFGIISLVAFRRHHKNKIPEWTWLEGIFNRWEMFLPAAVIGLTIAFSCIALFDLLEIIVAPGVYLLENVMNLVKHH